MVEHMVTIRISESQKVTLNKFRDWVKLTHKGRYYGVFGDEIINALESYMNLNNNHIIYKDKKNKNLKKEKITNLNLELREKLGTYLNEIENGKGISKDIFNNIFDKMFIGMSHPTIESRKKDIYSLNGWCKFNNKIISISYKYQLEEKLKN